MPETVVRVLVVHPEESTRQSIEETLRRLAEDSAVTVYHARSAAQGLAVAERFEPHYVLLDLSEERGLALDVAQELRRQRRNVIGLYNPLLVSGGQAEGFFRQAARAGVADFVPLPAGEAELQAALESSSLGRHEAPAGPGEGRLVSFLSPKGGVGTTTLAVSSALVLAGSGQVNGGVALCDASVPFGTASALLGMAPDRDLADLVKDLDDLSALAPYLTDDARTGLAVLAGPRSPYEAERLTPEALSRVLLKLRGRYARVVVDTPPTLDLLTLAAMDLSETLYVVTEAVAPTVLITQRFLGLLEDQGFGADRVRVVLNRYDPGAGNLEDVVVAEQLGRAIDHVIPFDRNVQVGANRGEPEVAAHPKSKFSQAVGGLAEEVLAGTAVAAH
jgi:pilus assembly protein CpaE